MAGIVDYGTGDEATWLIFVHEVGHLLGAEHVEYGIMESGTSSSGMRAHGKEQFWDANHNQISDCLDSDETRQCLY